MRQSGNILHIETPQSSIYKIWPKTIGWMDDTRHRLSLELQSAAESQIPSRTKVGKFDCSMHRCHVNNVHGLPCDLAVRHNTRWKSQAEVAKAGSFNRRALSSGCIYNSVFLVKRERAFSRRENYESAATARTSPNASPTATKRPAGCRSKGIFDFEKTTSIKNIGP